MNIRRTQATFTRQNTCGNKCRMNKMNQPSLGLICAALIVLVLIAIAGLKVFGNFGKALMNNPDAQRAVLKS